MKIIAQLVFLVSMAALLPGCLTWQFGDPPTAVPAAEKITPAPVSAAAPPPIPVSAPPAPAEPSPPVKEPPLKVVAETTQARAGDLLITGLAVAGNAIEIQASGQVGNYKLLTLSEPSRLVIDIPDAVSGFKQKTIPIDKLGIATVRFESHPGYLRIFLDATQWRIIPYRIEESGRSLKIIITAP